MPAAIDPLFQAVVEQARTVIGAHQAVVNLIGPDSSITVAGLSLSDKYAAYRTYDEQPQGTGIYTLVCRENRPMRMTKEEIERHPAWRNFGSQKGKHPPMRGWLAAPLVGLDGRNLGLIQLSDKYEGEFTAEDQDALVQMAHMASAASENARLIEEIRRTTHQFDNLLMVVTGFSELLLLQPGLTDAAQCFVKEVKNAGDKATSLLQELCKSCGVRPSSLH
jgi:GAF domain-containing protein